MNIIESIFSGGIQGLLGSAGQFAKDIRQAITGEISPEKKAELEQKALEIEFALTKVQTDINLEEAKNSNVFVSGWRPFVGWVCGSALAWQFIGSPVFDWAVKLSGKSITPPAMDSGSLIPVLCALLGIGGLRTYEKVKGSQGNH